MKPEGLRLLVEDNMAGLGSRSASFFQANLRKSEESLLERCVLIHVHAKDSDTAQAAVIREEVCQYDQESVVFDCLQCRGVWLNHNRGGATTGGRGLHFA